MPSQLGKGQNKMTIKTNTNSATTPATTMNNPLVKVIKVHKTIESVTGALCEADRVMTGYDLKSAIKAWECANYIVQTHAINKLEKINKGKSKVMLGIKTDTWKGYSVSKCERFEQMFKMIPVFGLMEREVPTYLTEAKLKNEDYKAGVILEGKSNVLTCSFCKELWAKLNKGDDNKGDDNKGDADKGDADKGDANTDADPLETATNEVELSEFQITLNTLTQALKDGDLDLYTGMLLKLQDFAPTA